MEPVPKATKTDVHAAWLSAGANGDVEAMRRLKQQFPHWVDFELQVGSATSDSTLQRQRRFCTWDAFHLRTLGASAVHTSAWEGSLDVLQFLLDEGADPDTRDESGMTPIMVAILRLSLMTMRCVFLNGEAVRRNLVVNCRPDEDVRREKVMAVLQLLLRFGAEINAQSHDGKTALHCSTSDDTFEIARFLLDSGASMDVQDETGKTPLHYCVQERGLLGTNLLLSRGADISVEDRDGVTPLMLMLQQANVNLLQIFLNHHHLVATSRHLDFASELLLQAVDNLTDDVVHFIVDNEYAPVTVTNAAGESALHRAIVKDSTGMIELLADLDPVGENLIATTLEGETPVHYAARYGSPQVMEMLLRCLMIVYGELQDLGVDNPLDTLNRSGETALYIAGTSSPSDKGNGCGNIRAETDTGGLQARNSKIQLLLQHGARIFSPDFLMPSDTSSPVSLPFEVQRCLLMWLVEDEGGTGEPEDEDAAHQYVVADDPMKALTDLCVHWIASVDCAESWLEFPSILICTGYAHEIVPLLVDLPLRRSSLPVLLGQLEKFGRRSRSHGLVLQLHNELMEAWQR